MCDNGNCNCNCGCQPREVTIKEQIKMLEEKKEWLEEKMKYISADIAELKKEEKKSKKK